MEWFKIISWFAVILLAAGYWFQIWKIHKHREVRDLSIVYYILLGLGFGILIGTAWYENTTIFLIKQIATFIPVTIIIFQIWYHRSDEWHDDDDKTCSCGDELEPNWKHCPTCAKITNNYLNTFQSK